MTTTPQLSQSKTKRKKIIILSSVAILPILIILAFALPFTVSDGTEKFTGKEARVAKLAVGDGLYHAPNTDPLPDLAFGFRAKVVRIYKNMVQEKCGSAGQGTTYMVEVNKISFFGIEAPGYVSSKCLFEN